MEYLRSSAVYLISKRNGTIVSWTWRSKIWSWSVHSNKYWSWAMLFDFGSCTDDAERSSLIKFILLDGGGPQNSSSRNTWKVVCWSRHNCWRTVDENHNWHIENVPPKDLFVILFVRLRPTRTRYRVGVGRNLKRLTYINFDQVELTTPWSSRIISTLSPESDI